jgi:CPA2 family monovalent cation:H+ antiporter-2
LPTNAHTLLQDLAAVMIVAAMVTLLFHRLRQPVVLGYLLAGFIIGPHLHLLPAPLVADQESITTLSELGVVFLMFSLGLEFSLRALKRVGMTAVLGATIEILGMIWVGYQLGQLFGWSRLDCLFLGAILSISSTTITVKVLGELGLAKNKFAQLCFGILIIEDILAIAIIALLSGIVATGTLEAANVIQTLVEISVFLVVVLIAGLIFVPPLLRWVARFKSDEMLLVTVRGLCFGLSLLAVKLEYSVALGAFMCGTIVGEAREIGRIKHLTEPVRDMFSAVFFVSIGMMIDPQLLGQYALPILVVTVAVVVGKIVTRSFGVFIAGNDTKTSVQVAMTLAQIGEFSFIIAGLGRQLNVTGEFMYPVAVSVSAITTLLTPYLIRGSPRVVGQFDQRAPAWIVNSLALYSDWVDRLRRGRKDSPGRSMVRKWSLQIALNMALVTAVYLAAVALTPHASVWWPRIPDALGGAAGVLWMGAAVVALPTLIAAIRKLEALAMLLSEMSVGRSPQTPSIRAIVHHTIYLSGLLGMGLWILVLSSAILPKGPSLIVLLLMISLVTLLLWRFFIQIHAKAQLALRETWAQPEIAPVAPPEEPLPTLLRDASLTTVRLEASQAAVGKLIRELKLRTQTGASIVGIERPNGSSVINPGPDEELLAGDGILLLGNSAQLEAAKAYLARSHSDESNNR